MSNKNKRETALNTLSLLNYCDHWKLEKIREYLMRMQDLPMSSETESLPEILEHLFYITHKNENVDFIKQCRTGVDRYRTRAKNILKPNFFVNKVRITEYEYDKYFSDPYRFVFGNTNNSFFSKHKHAKNPPLGRALLALSYAGIMMQRTEKSMLQTDDPLEKIPESLKFKLLALTYPDDALKDKVIKLFTPHATGGRRRTNRAKKLKYTRSTRRSRA
jgi:hypothetical protein